MAVRQPHSRHLAKAAAVQQGEEGVAVRAEAVEEQDAVGLVVDVGARA